MAFAESSVFPIPPDVLVVPMVLADRRRAFRIAAICTVSSVAGGLLGYLIGAVAFDAVGKPMLAFYGLGESYGRFQAWYSEWGLLIVFAAGLTPLPYKVFTIASGVAALNPVAFLGGSVASRGLRFFAEAGLLWLFGEPIRRFVENHLRPVSYGVVGAVVAGFVLARFVF